MNTAPSDVEGLGNSRKPSNPVSDWRVHSVSITAPAKPRSVGLLRSHVSVLFTGWVMTTDEQETAALVISELLTNAVRHGREEMTLLVARSGSTLDITVVDHGAMQATAAVSDRDEHGRGLAIVAAVTRELCIEESAMGWRTFARMDLDRSCPAQGCTV
ncbi:ATP-binding protein [Streptomyces sp. NPDC059224]|uniref:ATP-binding protein n=1 Tax=Streptomyces sp. NPDC059224 TaxID=3346775 RepID=UPI0036BCB068